MCTSGVARPSQLPGLLEAITRAVGASIIKGGVPGSTCLTNEIGVITICITLQSLDAKHDVTVTTIKIALLH